MTIHLTDPPEFATSRGALHILLVQHASGYSGSTMSGLLLAQGLRAAGHNVDVVFGEEGALARKYADAGCTVSVIPHKNWLRGGGPLLSLRRVIKETYESGQFVGHIRETRPDLVYVNSIVSLAAAVAARRTRTPCVWHLRELFDDLGGEMRAPAFGGRGLVRRLIQHCADHVVVISQAVRKNILGDNFRGPVSVIPNAVDDWFFSNILKRNECREYWDLPVDRPIIGLPGTLRPVKGHEFLLNAAATPRLRDTNCLFAITGDGEDDYYHSLRRLVARKKLERRVYFMGPVSRMPEFYRACDCVCIPSRSESFGRTVIEAFAVGTPVVASAVAGICETVENEVSGLLVNYGDVAALSSALVRLLGDEPLRTRLARAGLHQARSLYRAADYTDRVHAVIQNVLATRAAKQPLLHGQG
jgi:glycosyltransferase involved in cell wall biosynthesis